MEVKNLKLLKLKISYFYIILIFTFLSHSCQPIEKEKSIEMNWTSFDLDMPKGIQILQGVNKEIPLKAWVAVVDLSNEKITAKILSSFDKDRMETPSQFMLNTNALIVMNGGYFISNKIPASHVGLLKTDGILREPASPSLLKDNLRYFISRGAFGLSRDGFPDIAWATTKMDSIFQLVKPINNRPGFAAHPITKDEKIHWNVYGAIHAGPVLMSNGEINITLDEEVFFNTPIAGVHPRSAIGYTKKNELIMMVVDGRQPESRGVYLEELAIMLKSFNCHEALNLDGGGSSAIVADTRLLNRPSGLTSQREVMSAIGIFYNK